MKQTVWQNENIQVEKAEGNVHQELSGSIGNELGTTLTIVKYCYISKLQEVRHDGTQTKR